MMSPPTNRFSLKILMAFIAVIAIGLGLMRNGSATASQVAFSVALIALLVGLSEALISRMEGVWVGFALFGWAYFVMTCIPVMETTFSDRLLTKQPLEFLVERLNDIPPEPPALPFQQATNASGNPAGKWVDGQWVPMSPDEVRAHTDYLKQSNARSYLYGTLMGKIELTRGIGHSLLTLLFALAGAVVGRALGRLRSPEPEPTSPGA
jgi:hypothetical protein